MADSDPAQQQLERARARVAALRCQLEAAQGGRPVRLVETHISWLLLTRDEVFKLKKPLRLPFLDCTSLESRKDFCAEELRINGRLAPSIYRGLVEVRQQPDGVGFGGDGELVDYAVRMRRFADGCLWSERLAAGTLDAAQVDAMARRLAAFHDQARVLPPSSRFGSIEVHEAVTRRLVDAFDELGVEQPGFDWPRLRRWLLATQRSLAGFWEQRRQQGHIRECHGDLHLANLLQEEGGEPTAFDAIEFDAELRCIDVLEDIAFPVMDLLAHGHPELAWRMLDAYLEATGDHAGLPALRFYMVRRALVRAQVSALSAGIDSRALAACGAAQYRALAAALAFGPAPWLLITHGLPASGKSRAALQVVERCGAIRLRSDVERKRLHGLAALESSRGVADIYTEQSTLRTYRRLLQLAELALRAGWPVIVDAAFLRRSERGNFAALASSLGLRFGIVDCRAPEAVLRERIERRLQRADDASEADLSVLERLGSADEAPDAAESAQLLVVDAAAPGSAQAAIDDWLRTTGAA